MGKFLSNADLMAAKHEQEVFNSKINRGEIDTTTYVRTQYVVCGCGAEGCGFITRWLKSQYNVIDFEKEYDEYHKWLKKKSDQY